MLFNDTNLIGKACPGYLSYISFARFCTRRSYTCKR